MRQIDWRIIVAAIVGLVIIECMAMANGINGTLRTMVIGAICAMAGLMINPFSKK